MKKILLGLAQLGDYSVASTSVFTVVQCIVGSLGFPENAIPPMH